MAIFYAKWRLLFPIIRKAGEYITYNAVGQLRPAVFVYDTFVVTALGPSERPPDPADPDITELPDIHTYAVIAGGNLL